ncbi:MAG: LytTR family DNA-binding domain-containing protein [Bacteroidota bacterium]
MKTIIVDDEADSREALRTYLGRYCPDVEIIAEGDGIETGLASITKHRPDLLFLDIEMPFGNAFDLIERLPENLDTELVFVTAYDQYAIRAFDFAALGYLLKPLRITDLRDTLERFFVRRLQTTRTDHRLRTFLSNKHGEENRLVVPDLNGFRVINLPQIVYLRGEVNYTRFFLSDGNELLSSKTLKEYERLLGESGFCRIHQSFLINLSHVTSYQRGEGGVVKLTNGDHSFIFPSYPTKYFIKSAFLLRLTSK